MKQNRSQSGPGRRWRAIGAVIAAVAGALLLSPLLARPALAQEIVNPGPEPIQVNPGTTVYVGNTFTNTTSGTFTSGGAITIAQKLNFQTGVITNTGLLAFVNDATATNASDTSHVDGPVRKIGNDAFVFPTGNKGHYGPVGISAPSSASAQVDALYSFSNPQIAKGATLGSGLTALSIAEYWVVTGTPAVNLTLYWSSASNTSALASNLADLRVAGWDGAKWVNLNNNGTTGNTTAGTITANAITPNTYSAYAIATNVAALTPDLTTTIGQPSPNFVAGSASNVPMTVTNAGQQARRPARSPRR